MKKSTLFLLVFLSTICSAQFSKTHYIPPLSGADGQPVQNQYIYISSPSLTPVNFIINSIGGATVNGTVSKSSPYVHHIGFGTATQLHVNNATVNTILSNKGFIIEAEDQIYVAVRLTATTQNFQGGGLVSKGLAGLGTQFRIGAFVNTGISAINWNHFTFVSVLATENNTTVNFTDIKPGVLLINNAAVGNLPSSIILNRGQSFVMATEGPTSANRDGLIGSLVSSNKPIAVNCGSFGGTNGTNSGNLDLGFDQIVSVERTGTEYIFVKGFGENVLERPLLVAHEDNTEIYLNGNTVTPDYTLNAGQYLALDGSNYSANGNLYVRSSKNIFAYQSIGGNSQANQEMYFVPPLSCQTPKIIDNIPFISLIGSLSFTTNSGVNIVTETGASLSFTVDGQDFTLTTLPPSIIAQGPFTIPGNANFVTYKITGITGTLSVFSTNQIYLSYFGSNNAATYGGYYSGFTFKPEISFNRLDVTSSNCIPNVNLGVSATSSFDVYQWYFNNVAILGANGPTYTPTQPGYYYLSATVLDCGITLISDKIPVSGCPTDTDLDGVIDNVDLDLDNDGITNCTESLGNLPLDLSNLNNGNITLLPYSNTFTGTLSTTGTGTPSTQPIVGNSNGIIITETALGINNTAKYEMNFLQPTSILIEYADIANVSDLLSTTGEFIINGPVEKTITLLNPNGQLLVDTNYDGVYENNITEYSSFEIRFRLNSAIPLPAGTGTFKFRANLTNYLSITHNNISDGSSKATFKIIATCLPIDSDNDLISNQLDIDSDNDGIPDFVESQGLNVVALSNVDINADGIDDVFGAGIIPADTDNDGIPNYLDLDSDNDGIYDLFESGSNTTDTNLDGVIDGNNFGTNGLFDGIETVADNGILNYTIADTDTNGINNYISLDSDNDLCLDVIEAGYLDPNNDGLLGNIPLTVNAFGVVTSGLGYTLPNVNYIISAPIVINTNLIDIVVCNTQNTTLNISTNAVTVYQWQISTDNGVTWSNITNNTTYSGVATASLFITAASTAMNNFRYRVSLTKTGNTCGLLSLVANLTVNALPTLVSVTNLVQCDSDADGITDVNLRQKEDVISVNYATETFTYYTTLLGAQTEAPAFLIANPIAYNTGNTTVWVNVRNANNCISVAQLNVFVSATQIPSNTRRYFAVCDDYVDATNNDRDGVAAFDMTSANTYFLNLLPTTSPFTIKYYKNEADANAETDAAGNSLEINFTNYRNIGYPNFQSIWVRVESLLDNSCFGLGPFIELTVEALPLANTIANFKQCDDNQDGSYPFNTSTIESTILNGQNPANVTFSYFDANNIALPSPLPNPFLTQSQTITIRVTNNITVASNGPCYDETTLTFIVDKRPIANPVVITPDCNNDGIFTFNTSTLESTLLNGQTGMVVTYFDAAGMPLPSPFSSTFTTSNQNITAVVTNPNNTTCPASTIIRFVINPLPQLLPGYDDIICFGVDYTTMNAGLISGGVTNFTYQWYRNNTIILGAANYSLTVNQNGAYTVEVTNRTTFCKQTRIINVIYSEPATIDSIEIIDLVESNTITINVSGSGDYVYSLDSNTGLFQESNVFVNVLSGVYTLYIKDLNDCGIVTRQINVIGVPKFFTPNGDGHNDTWNVKGISQNYNSKTKIYIFDRYGKLLKELHPLGNGWDGTNIGNPLPSTDYWYTVYFEDGRTVKGHFALKR